MGGLRGRGTIGAGPIESHPEQTVIYVEAGTQGRLLRLCMNIARNHPEWNPVGRIEVLPTPGGNRLRQKLRRRLRNPGQVA